ncbi:MAG: hypothetical protein HUK14_00540 [Muribaculaceae bacterium]|nr:hypothetical protein [Muribaculaceae bacterium]
MTANTSLEIREEIALSMGISDRLVALIREKNIGKFELAKALGKRPNEVTRRLSGQHNFTLRTLSMLSFFFGEPIVSVY